LAHEVKNPLGGIRGAAQLLEQELESPELREYTGIVIREADRLRKLVDRMLGPNTLPRRRRCNVHEILEQVRALIAAEGRAKIVLARDYDPSIPPLWADPDQLLQAFLNIVQNAVEALDEGGVITVRTRVQRQCSIGPRRNKLVACVDVVDNGPGISQELMQRIFLPMITTRSKGTGLGLSIAQNLVNQHQGLIECSSRPGETVFTTLLPVETGDE
jgi:two-component system nitrogen regulation sensor histidine kinase GlnL